VRKGDRIFVAGTDSLLGGAILRRLRSEGYTNLLGAGKDEPCYADALEVDRFFRVARPEYVFMAAGKSGGIEANSKRPAELILDNLLAACHIIHSAHLHGARKLLYLASSCSYPRDCPQPMRVEKLLSGPFEPTNDAYATAKVAGIKMCLAYRAQYGANFIAGIPPNSFGPGDDFSPDNSHVIAALMRKMHEAKVNGDPFVTVWGTGRARREFLFAADVADACLFVMEHYDRPEPINLGGGTELSIAALAERIREVVGYPGELRYDSGKPDGMPLKMLDSQKLAGLGWRPKTPFRDAILATYEAFKRSARPAA